MSKKITANDLINKMDQDPDIVRLKGIKLQDLWDMIYSFKEFDDFAVADRGNSVCDILTKDGALDTVAFLLNSLSNRKEGKNGYFYRHFPCNYMKIYDSSLHPVLMSNEKYILDLEVIVKDLISELSGEAFLTDLIKTISASVKDFSFFPEITNHAPDDVLEFLYSVPVEPSSVLDLTYVRMINEHFLEKINTFHDRYTSKNVDHIAEVLSYLLGLVGECKQDRGDTEMYKFTKQKRKVCFLEKKVAFDTMFIFVLLSKVLEAIKHDNSIDHNICKTGIPNSPLQMLMDENFDKGAFFIIKEQRKLLMKVVWYCSLMRLKVKRKNILDDNNQFLSSEIINHVYKNVSWLDSNSTRTAQYFWSLTKKVMGDKKYSHIEHIYAASNYKPVSFIDLSTRRGIKNFMGEYFDPDNILWRTSKPKKAD